MLDRFAGSFDCWGSASSRWGRLGRGRAGLRWVLCLSVFGLLGSSPLSSQLAATEKVLSSSHLQAFSTVPPVVGQDVR